MSLAITVTWGGAWAAGQRLTPTLLNSIFQNATFDLSGTITAASKPAAGIDSTWLGTTFYTGMTSAAPATGDIIDIWDISAAAVRRTTLGDVLALGFPAPAQVLSVTSADEAVVLVSTVQKRVEIREFGKAATAYQIADGVDVSAGALALTDELIASKAGTQGVATVQKLLDALGTVPVLAPASLAAAADYLLMVTAAGLLKRILPTANQTGLTAFIQFDGRSTGLTAVTGQNLTENLTAETVTFSSGHGITTGETRQGWWATTCPLTSTPAMAIDTAYWIRATSGTAVAFYTNAVDAAADTNRINLTADSGGTGWTFYFWTSSTFLANSGGTIGVNGVVVLERATPLDVGDYGKYRVFLKSAASLTHPCVTANARYYYGDGAALTAVVRVSASTYTDIWTATENGTVVESNPVNVMIQS